MPKPYNERVLDKVLIDYTISECHIWTGAKYTSGYGFMRPPDQTGFQGKVIYAHRYFYKQYNPDENIDGLLIRHTCDNRLCVRKEHLVSGSSQDNVDDMKERPKEKVFNSKLRPGDIRAIRVRLANGDRIKDIASDYGLKDRHTISDIKYGRTWAWVN